jgi:hypothetical protein
MHNDSCRYGFWSYIYFMAGGLDVLGHPYIYPLLDWRSPDTALGLVFGCVVAFAFTHCIVYGLYRIRNDMFHAAHLLKVKLFSKL